MKKLLGIVVLGLLLCSPGSSESTWDSNYRYNKQKWDATSTNHIKNSIFKDREFKRDASSKESIHFILETQKCIPHSTSGDCERTVRRSQIRSKKTYKRDKDIFLFSAFIIKKSVLLDIAVIINLKKKTNWKEEELG